MFGSGNTKLIISKKKLNDIMKMFKSHEESDKRRLQNNSKWSERTKKKKDFLETGKGTIREGEPTVRAGQDF